MIIFSALTIVPLLLLCQILQDLLIPCQLCLQSLLDIPWLHITVALTIEEYVFDLSPAVLYAFYDSLCLKRWYDLIFRTLKNLRVGGRVVTKCYIFSLILLLTNKGVSI